MASDPTLPIKAGAKLDPKGTAMIKKLKELSKKSQAELGGDSVAHLRIMPKNRPPSANCSCMCGCS